MATIVTRAGKGSPLTNNEVDANFENLNAEVTPLRHSIRPSLLLDFANSKQLDPRITFSRASTGTYYDGKTFAKAEENLLTNSNDPFSSAPNGTKTANSITAPDGTTTAATFTEDSATGVHGVSFSFSPDYFGTTTASVYVKAGTKTTVSFSLYNNYNNNAYLVADLSAGTITQSSGFGSVTLESTSIQSVGNSWYRLILVVSSTTRYIEGVYVAGTTSSTPTINNNDYGYEEYAGDGSSDFYVWGAQLEQRDSVTAYTPTTTQPITNYIPVLQTAAAGTARFDHDPVTGESKGLLIEEQRTNLLTYSEDFSNAAWSKSGGGGATITSNIIVAPDGNLTGDKLIPNAATSSGFAANQLVSTSDATFSVFAKAGEKDKIMLFGASKGYGFDLTSGTTFAVGGITASDSATITDVGNGWYKCSIYVSGSWTRADIYVLNSTSYSSYTGDGYSGVYIWGAQLEAGAFPTSYIKTTSAQATRNADAATVGINASTDWFNYQQGTIYVNATNHETGTGSAYGRNGALIAVGVGYTTTYYRPVLARAATNTIVVQGQSAYGNNVAFGLESPNNVFITDQEIKAAFTLNNQGTPILAADGVSYIGTSVQPVPPNTDGFYLGRNYDQRSTNHFKKIAYYPAALTSAELAALTEA